MWLIMYEFNQNIFEYNLGVTSEDWKLLMEADNHVTD
jgi:hypothetical protein